MSGPSGSHIAVIGDCLVDIAISPTTSMSRGGDAPASVRLAPGGQGANVAVRLARRGHEVHLAAPLADDPAGTLLAGALAADGVTLIRMRTQRSGAVAILLARRGERSMLSDRVALPRGWRSAVAGALRGAGWVVCSGYALADAAGPALAARLAARRGARLVVAGSAVETSVAGRLARTMADARPDVVVLNRSEARALLGRRGSLAELASRIADRLGTGVAVVTGGRKGSAAWCASATVRIAATMQRSSVVDATGAGDAYTAALVSALAAGPWPPRAAGLRAAMRDASREAGAVARVRGAQTRVRGERGA